MKIAGTIALSAFPMWRQSVQQLCDLCDVVFVRFDGVAGDPEILQGLAEFKDKIGHIFTATVPWSSPQWMEDKLRMADGAKPDIVLTLDEDELFGDNIKADLDSFAQSDRAALLFDYEPLVTSDGRVANGGHPYPGRECKAFKWRPGLSFFPLHPTNMALPAQYIREPDWMLAESKMRHFCCFTPQMEVQKRWHGKGPGHMETEKAVTILGFGPSSREQMDRVGEIWSLNNAYETYSDDSMKWCTRLFEMHTFGPRAGGWWDKVAAYQGLAKLPNRNNLYAADGRRHVDHLNALALNGIRIILQEPHPEIAHSEAYPLADVEAATGAKMWTGTPGYMIALAICEGYNHIRIYGFDQMDKEHVVQRESLVFWCGMAVGRNIRLDGALTFMERHQRRYGYDYGPEFDSEMQRLLWSGHPIEVIYKDMTRAGAGRLYAGGK